MFRRDQLINFLTLFCWVVTILLWAPSAYSANLPATGDEQSLWVVRNNPNDETFALLYREADQQSPGIQPILTQIHGELLPRGLTANDSQLWLVYKSSNERQGPTVQSIRIPRSSPSRTLIKPSTHIQPALPARSNLRSLAASQSGLWALIRSDSLPDLDRARPTTTTKPALPDQTIKPNAEADSSAKLSEETHAKSDLAGTTPKDYLLQLDRNRWKRVDLPEDWHSDAHAWIVMRRADHKYPTLISVQPSIEKDLLWVYHHKNNKWTRNQYDLTKTPQIEGLHGSSQSDLDSKANINPDSILVPLAVDGQLVISQVQPGTDQVKASLSVLRQERVIPLGDLLIQAEAIQSWAIVPYNQTATLLTLDGESQLAWARLDLQGRQSDESSELTQAITIPLTDAADYVVLVSVLVLATIVMFASWRRDPSWHRLNLPEKTTLAQISQRLFAGAIDLSPCLMVSLLVYDIEPVDLIQEHWPGRSGGWEQMLPGATAIGLFVLHTMVFELMINQTIGKRMLGLRVTSLDGQRPTAWQIVVRCFTKGFDLVAWLLLILPMVGPYRQRLGDLIARTVVIAPEPKAPPDQAKDS